MEEFRPYFDLAKPYAIAFGCGFVLASLTTAALALYGWARGRSYHLDDTFSLFHPLVKVDWDSKRFGDAVVVVNCILCALLAGLAYVLVPLPLAIATTAGLLFVLLVPYSGNVLLGIIDRYQFEPPSGSKPVAEDPGAARAGAPAPAGSHRAWRGSAGTGPAAPQGGANGPGERTGTPERGTSSPEGAGASSGGGWRNRR